MALWSRVTPGNPLLLSEGKRATLPSSLVGSKQLGRHLSATQSPGSALPRQQDGKERKFWEAEGGGISLLPNALIYALIYFHICHLQAELNLSSKEQRSCFGWGWDENRVAVEWNCVDPSQLSSLWCHWLFQHHQSVKLLPKCEIAKDVNLP